VSASRVHIQRAVPKAGFLSRDRIVAGPGFNRWLVPPAALAIHLCLGMAYGFSVFWLPLSRAVGRTAPLECPTGAGALTFLYSTNCDWLVSDLDWIFSLFIVFLGTAAAIWGGSMERVGPRKAGVFSAILWSGGLLIGAVGIYFHQLWILWLGTGVFGGIGLGLGYISPISTLIKWFPDRRGMAIGLAVMGFGGGPLIGAPLAQALMTHFGAGGSGGVWQTFMVMGLIYLVFMMGGALGYRVPPPGWQPAGWIRPKVDANAMMTTGHVHVRDAHKTSTFWAIWVVLCMNVSAGIGVLSMASPMLQEIFGGALIGHPQLSFTDLNESQLAAIATIAAGFAGLLSLFNIGGRFSWATLSDHIGRRATYFVFFPLGFGLYLLAPYAAHTGNKMLFAGFFCVILSMYGGGFATVPAYVADMFGTLFVGAIHGRMLTAWSFAGIIGPVLVSYMRDSAIAAGVARASVYDRTLYLLAGMQIIGLLANMLVRPVPDKWLMTQNEVLTLQGTATNAVAVPSEHSRFTFRVVLAWATVVLPLLWGVAISAAQLPALFR
jgi:MFS family permease